MSFLSRLFGRCPKEVLEETLAPYKTEPKRKRKNHLSTEHKNNLVTDININKMSFREVAHKYNVTEQTARNIYKKSYGSSQCLDF